ncbi:MAG TPA: M48 family metallopeptidase [Ktedonobacterales bacterium]|nr:M48 family metallopeptidase [Ktedonobacterales bacterium]
MTITYQSQSFPGFQDYIAQQEQEGLSGPDSAPLYAHPVDGWIIRTLNATPVKSVMNKALDALVSYQFGYDLSRSIFIDQGSFPDIFEILSRCSKTLGIPIPHAVTRHDVSLYNAYTAGTDEYAFINISSTLCQHFTPDESAFVVGHECGHIASGHMVYHTLASTLTGGILNQLGPIGAILRLTAGIPLLAWSRRSEVTADRAGLLCCGDIVVAERALLRLVTGLADSRRVDMDDFLRRSKEVQGYHSASVIQELNSTHPIIPKRIEALRLFANSEIYYTLSGKPRPEGKTLLSQDELNRRVSEIVRP